ncbi:titin isoform X1 [Salmo trutta]|uniref:Rab11 family-interacting protein 1-like n=2 Tax=Salmo trutta TaxID=8032 RepID=A0A674EXQ4_SALTR|nr:titin-like isoform X1 [Salmo trutta]
MSLADQSQQWYPTSVQVTVFQARNLRIKGKNGTNDAYAIMQVAKDKFSTSVAEKCVAPVWKEEATFDLPLFHHGNAERCTLYIIVMHRALVGLDKLLGRAVINLLDLHDNSARKNTDWHKLLDKNGKEDKVRGEVMLDIQFMRNNLTASMFDLSMKDKPRSRIGKLKDKVRGKKKDGFSDSASAIVPSFSEVVIDSEGEADSHSVCPESPGAKKKSKLKSLFAPKSNLQRNVSQSMSTLGTLPEKNASLSGSRSSGLNVDSPDVKKKFKFLGHKRTGSNDSKVSTGPFSLLGRTKQKEDPNSTCINGNHVYAEEVEPMSGSTLSLNSSGQGSVEDVRSHRQPSDAAVDSLKGAPVNTYRKESADRDRALLEQRHLREEGEKRQAEEKRHNEEKQRVQLKVLQEEERKQREEQERRFQEDEARRKKQQEEEEDRKRRLKADEHQRLGEEQRKQEEAKKAEEQKQQEEASVTERLSSLFGIIRKKEEKKEELQQSVANEVRPNPSPSRSTRDLEVPLPAPRHAANPFKDVLLSSDPPIPFEESPVDHQKGVCGTNTPSAAVFNSNRTAKVSAVKPRLVESLKQPETPNSDSHRQQSPSLSCAESPLSSVPSESPDMFSNLHSSLAPPKTRRSTSESPCSSTENLAAIGSSPSGSERKRQAPLPPSPMELHSHGNPNAGSRSVSAKCGSLVTIKEVEAKRPPLPDYDRLFKQKRHGVQGQTQWDHIIAEVNQRQQECTSQLIGEEMSVDGPGLDSPAPPHNDKYSYLKERAAERLNQQQTQVQEVHSSSFRRVGPNSSPALIPPPKPGGAAPPRLVIDSNKKQGQNTAQANPSIERHNAFVSKVLGSTNPMAQSSDVPSVKPWEDARKVPKTSVALASEGHSVLPIEKPTRLTSREVLVSSCTDEPKGLPNTLKEIPATKPRQRLTSKEPVRRVDPEPKAAESTTNVQQESRSEMRAASTPDFIDMRVSSPVMTKNTEVTANSEKQPSSDSVESDNNKKQLERIMKETFSEPDPFPIAEVLPKYPWAQPEQSHSGDDLFSGGPQKEDTLEQPGMKTDDLDKHFTPNNSTDPSSSCNDSDSEKHPGEEKPEEPSPFQRGFSQRKKERTDFDPPAPPLNDKYSYLQERAAECLIQQQTQVQEVQSWRRVVPNTSPALIPPPKPRRLEADSNKKQSQSTAQNNTSERHNTFVSKVLVSTNPMPQSRDVPSVKPREDARKVLNTSVSSANDGKSVLPIEKPNRPTQVLVSSSTDEPKGLPNTPKEIPSAKPRQSLVSKEQADPEPTSAEHNTVQQEKRSEIRAVSTPDIVESSPTMAKATDSVENDINKKQLELIMKETFDDPFPIAEILPKDPWAQPEQSHSGDDLFSGGPQKDDKLEQRLTTDDFVKLFVPNNPTDLFSSCNDSDSEKHPEEEKPEEPSPAFQRKNKRAAPQPPATLSNKRAMGKGELVKQDPSPRENETVRLATTGSVKLEPQAKNTRQRNLYGREKVETQARKDKWTADPFTFSRMSSDLTSPEPPQSVGEPNPQAGAEGKTLLRAWVSTSELQPLTVLSSNGDRPALTPLRPHPVKPMSSMESHALINTPVVREMKTYDSSLGNMKTPGKVESGPFTQLTQEELITLVVKQQTELSKKDSKIVELEEYIDNLLVRVIEEKPSILQGLNSPKQAL